MEITKQGLENLKQKLHYLTNEKRREISNHIRAAKELGDLSENAGYKEAKEQQGLNENEIADLQKQIKCAKVIDNGLIKDVVQIGTNVILKTANGIQKNFDIVNVQDSDPSQGKISNESPLGKALLGRKTGEKLKVIMPNGSNAIYTIMDIKS